MRSLTRLTGILVLFTLFTPAQAEETEQAQREQLEILFRLTQMEKKIQESVDSIVQLELRRNPQLQADKQVLESFLQKHIGWQAMKAEIAQMYLETFSLQELKDMNAFYITPVGQKVITVVPQLVQQRNQLAMSRLQQHIGELRELVAKEPVK
jgi:hypothetical protein